jgi:hypothetical protein
VGNDGATGIEPEQKPLFFPVGLAAYVVGTTVTVAVNVLTGSPQPALVWIVPCVLGFPLAAAALTGRTGELLAYRDPTPPELEEGGL